MDHDLFVDNVIYTVHFRTSVKGSVNCINKWQPIITSYGVCHKLELVADKDYKKLKPLKQSNSVLGLIVAVNLRMGFAINYICH